MNRAYLDNDLLAACRLQGKVGAYCAAAGVAIGCVWFLCLAWRAGAI